MIDPHFFAGFTIGAFVSLFIATVFFAQRYRELWDLKESLRKHPSTLLAEPELRLLGDWGSALEGWDEE